MIEKVHNFSSTQELDRFIATKLIEDFKKPGLVILPSGNSFEQTIYPLVNEHYIFRKENELDLEINPELKITHLDELIPDNEEDEIKLFSTAILDSMPELFSNLAEEFLSIKPAQSFVFDKLIKSNGGARSIYCGLGSDPELAHIAFIGEEYINTTTTVVTLSEAMQEVHACSKALTLGTDAFALNNLEEIVVVARGPAKARSLVAGMEDPDTGLGYLVKNHLDKLSIYTDHEAIKGLRDLV